MGGYVRLFDLPGTLSGDILRLEYGFPPNIPRHCEMEGGIIRPLQLSRPPSLTTPSPFPHQTSPTSSVPYPSRLSRRYSEVTHSQSQINRRAALYQNYIRATHDAGKPVPRNTEPEHGYILLVIYHAMPNSSIYRRHSRNHNF